MASGHLVGLCGSLRQASLNKKLMLEAARLFAPAEFIQGDLRLPLYDGDLEHADGIPPAVQTLADHIAAADAVVVVTPEYNKAMSGVLKNALDWISRTKPNPWQAKPVAILSAAAGRAGGERAQMTLQHALSAFRPRLLTGPEVLVAKAQNEFDETGRLMHEGYIAALTELMGDLRHAAGLDAS